MSSTTIKSGDLITWEVKANGSAIPDDYQVYSIYVEKAINRISFATIVVLDGDPTQEKFKVSSSATFVPGNKVTIEAGYDSQNTVIFEGIVTKQTLRVDEEIGSALEVECRDEAVKMIVGRKSKTFSEVKDSDVISQLIGDYSGISSNVTATSDKWPELTQYYASDWDFMLTRAEANSMIVTAINGKVSVFKPDADTSSVLTIQYGDNMYGFQADLDAITQLGQVKASSWDYKTQKVISGQTPSSKPGPGNLSSKKLSAVVGLSNFELQTTAAQAQTDLTNWSKAQMLKSELSKIRGEVRFQGSSKVDPGKYITIGGMGDRFDGDHLVSKVVHDISEGNWFTEASLGLSPVWFAQEPDVMAPSAAGLLPGARGLFNATVKKIHEDPDSEYRILVDVPLFDQNGKGIWARLTNFYSTSGAGAFFLPEIGDEVILGFLNEDPGYPVILGSVYSSSKKKPFSELSPNEKNSTKAIVTKSELRVVFDDENKILTITTPANNTFVLDDKNKQIKLSDENKNTIKMSSTGIAINSPKNIDITAKQKVTIKGNMGVTVKASTGDVSVSGLNVKEKADMEYSAEGSLTASVKGGAQLTIKAAMVMIN